MRKKTYFDQILAGPGSAPCKGCEGRGERCHCYCIWYKEYQERRAEFLEKQHEKVNNSRSFYRTEYWDEKRGAWRRK